MAKKHRECLTCGTEYSYCPNCNRNEPSWKAEFHNANCKNIFQICTQYNVGLLTKEKAREELNSCDLTNKGNFAECVQRDLNNIFEEDAKKRGKKVEALIIEEVVEPTFESHEVVTIENE